ncbi:hypothetical protein ACJCFO_002871 [Acinetobacter baumannii]|nr:hypothetical protein [Acinetobacter baumannii]EKU8237885.1 hypothetical protein [Acinetobacter baumannii]EKU8309811.1 hypothetical protein [Acinetobacter baumannii]EKU8413594.1 hypothetical protein [Acinetobacter baumannii]EKU9263384.1 hypothetical protein [Acinetobacter baumannii]
MTKANASITFSDLTTEDLKTLADFAERNKLQPHETLSFLLKTVKDASAAPSVPVSLLEKAYDIITENAANISTNADESYKLSALCESYEEIDALVANYPTFEDDFIKYLQLQNLNRVAGQVGIVYINGYFSLAYKEF